MFVELFRYLSQQRKFWLMPILLTLIIIGGLMMLAQGSVLAPFIYTLF